MRVPRPIPDQAFLREILDYNPQTGKLIWKTRDVTHFPQNGGRSQQVLANVWNGKNAGEEAFTSVSSAGYHEGSIDGINYLAHRIIYKWVHGVEPLVVDHDDRDTLNNRERNLVNGTQKINMRNRKLSKNSTSGYNGVYQCPRTFNWIARITIDGVQKTLGTFPTIKEAAATRDAANSQHNFHPNHGK